MDPAAHLLAVLESVCCLECGEVYAKPAAGGTALTNPGCPECGYLGWMPLSPAARVPRRRSDGGLPPLRDARPR